MMFIEKKKKKGEWWGGFTGIWICSVGELTADFSVILADELAVKAVADVECVGTELAAFEGVFVACFGNCNRGAR
jgi:hypothetical protein